MAHIDECVPGRQARIRQSGVVGRLGCGNGQIYKIDSRIDASQVGQQRGG